jgi:hypothetical protein
MIMISIQLMSVRVKIIKRMIMIDNNLMSMFRSKLMNMESFKTKKKRKVRDICIELNNPKNSMILMI